MIPEIKKTTVQHKTWDSNFFGFPVGDLYALCDEQFFSQQLKNYKRDGYRLLYWKVDSEDVPSLQIADTLQFTAFDTKITYRLNLNLTKPKLKEDSPVKKYTGAITKELIELGLQSGDYSRFKMDKNFPAGTFEKMYEEWISNSFSAENADAIFTLADNNVMQAFATVFNNEEDMEIVLIAVAPEFRKKGFGKMLVEYVSAYAYKNEYKNLYVVTQEQNKPACQLYESCGFSPIKKEFIYHIWL